MRPFGKPLWRVKIDRLGLFAWEWQGILDYTDAGLRITLNGFTLTFIGARRKAHAAIRKEIEENARGES